MPEDRVEVVDLDHPYTRSLPRGTAYGTDVNVEGIRDIELWKLRWGVE